MTTTTKVILAAFALFVGVLIVYYGVFSPGGDPASAAASGIVGDNQVLREPSDAQLHATPALTEHVASPGALQDLVQPTGTQVQPADSRGLLSETVQATVTPGGTTPPIVAPLVNYGTTGIANDQQTPPLGIAARPNANGPAANPTTPVTIPPANNSVVAPPVRSEYAVKSGDTMSSIALAWFGEARKWRLIAQENPLVDPNKLKIGQRLRMPAKDAKMASARPGRAPTSTISSSGDPVATPSGTIHTVQTGETLSSIALDAYGDDSQWQVIYDANRSALHNDPDELNVGMKLVIPRLRN